ncbi:MAG: STAS domain-containing protein [Pirellulales bacterium]
MNRRLQIEEVGDVAIVRFLDRRILDDDNIKQLGQQLFRMVDEDQCYNILLNFSNVDFLSSAALGKFITLEKKIRSHGGKLLLSNLRPEIYDTVFALTLLNRVFDIKEDEAQALAAFT